MGNDTVGLNASPRDGAIEVASTKNRNTLSGSSGTYASGAYMEFNSEWTTPTGPENAGRTMAAQPWRKTS